MKKKLQIISQVNLVEEASGILSIWINREEDMQKLWQKYSGNFQDRPDELRECRDLLQEIYHSVKEHLSGKKERIEYYFKSRAADFSTLGHLALLWNNQKYDNSLQSYEERFAGMTEAQKVKQFAEIIDIDATLNTSLSTINTAADLIAFIEASAYENEVKWEAIKIFTRQEVYYNEVCSILREIVELLQDSYGERINRLGQKFYDYWTGVQQESDIKDILQEMTKVTWQSSEAGIILMPVIFQPFGIGIYTEDEDRSLMDILRVGILIDRHFILKNKEISKEEIVEAGKLLSDKSKVDILELVSKRPCYGKELSNVLKLSTATISYHVNALHGMGLLKADINANKVYYSLNRERLLEYLDQIKEYFMKL